jgi:hypothetical protein
MPAAEAFADVRRTPVDGSTDSLSVDVESDELSTGHHWISSHAEIEIAANPTRPCKILD